MAALGRLDYDASKVDLGPDGAVSLTQGPSVVGRAALHGGTTTIIDFTRWTHGRSVQAAIEERMAQWREDVALQVTLDFGPVLAPNGKPNEDRLKDLDFGSGPLEVPNGIPVASAASTMEARLVLGEALSTIALGRVARLDAASSAIQLLPSTAIYALHQQA